MKILIAVKSCQKDMEMGCHQAIRETWAPDLLSDIDLRFFMGGENPCSPGHAMADPYKKRHPFLPDEILLEGLDDTYWVLWPKVKRALQFSIENNYDYTFLCDTDTYLVPPHWYLSGFEKFDYSGRMAPAPGLEMGKPYPRVNLSNGEFADPFYAYMSGGVGYFVSKKAAQIILADTAYRQSEDVASGQILGPLIAQGVVTGAHLPDLEGKGAFHLNCGHFGGGHHGDKRLDPATAMRKKHEEMR